MRVFFAVSASVSIVSSADRLYNMTTSNIQYGKGEQNMNSSKLIRALLCLFMVMVMLVTTVPVSFAADSESGMTVKEVMKHFEKSVQKPRQASVLDEPVEMTVASKNGNYINVMSKPRNGKALGKAKEDKTIVVYAKQGGYALGVVKGTSIGGWIDELYLTWEKENYTKTGAAGESLDLDEIMDKFDPSVQEPKKASILDESEEMVVKAKHGHFINVMSAPKGGKEIQKAKDGKTVYVYARQNGYALAIVRGTSIGGWMDENLLKFK